MNYYPMPNFSRIKGSLERKEITQHCDQEEEEGEERRNHMLINL